MHATYPLRIRRLPNQSKKWSEIKDPSVVQLAGKGYIMYASIGNSQEQVWQVGRFVANDIHDIWQELDPVIIHNLNGPQLCAPAVTYEEFDGEPLWNMYIQTACFEENGVIALATSKDGHRFYGETTPIATRDSVVDPILGVYDVGISTVIKGTEELQCMLYSGYRRIGCGDIYLSTKKRSDDSWSSGKRLLTQEDIPFHNRPDYENFEWGLEGAKLVQLEENCYLLIGVCFMPRPNQFLGTRQRVFFAASRNLEGPFQAIGMPFLPEYAHQLGENGHADLLLIGDKVEIIYQEREGEGKPWYLRSATFDKDILTKFLDKKLGEVAPIFATPANYHFQMY